MVCQHTGTPRNIAVQKLMIIPSANATPMNVLARVEVYASRMPGCVLPDQSLTNWPLLTARMATAAAVPVPVLDAQMNAVSMGAHSRHSAPKQ